MALVDRMNQEVKQLKPSDILQFNAAISGIEGIVKLTLGEPDFPTPEHVKAAGIASIENNESQRTSRIAGCCQPLSGDEIQHQI